MTYNILQGQNSPPCQYCILVSICGEYHFTNQPRSRLQPSKMGISISTWAWKNDPKGQGSHGTKFPAHRLMGWDHEMCSRAATEDGVHSTRCGSPYGVESWKLVPSQSLFRCGSNRDFQPEGRLREHLQSHQGPIPFRLKL